MGSPALTIEGIYEDVIRGVLSQRIDGGAPNTPLKEARWSLAE